MAIAIFLMVLIPIAILWALVVFPSFRIVALILCLVGGIAWVGLSENQEVAAKKIEKDKSEKDQLNRIAREKQREQQKILWSKVLPDRVELRDVDLKAPSYGGDSYDFTASLKNLSNVKVGGFVIEITALDCVAKNNCEIIGKSTETIWADTPPQQVRGISSPVIFRNVPKLHGTLTVTAKIIRVSTGDILANFESDWLDR